MNQIQHQLEKIKEAYQKQERINFKIIAAKENGFLVKTCGLFAFVSFTHFCWSYPVPDYWQVIAPLLVGGVYSGKVYTYSEKPFSIILDAKEQPFEKPPLQIEKIYRAIILQKSKYGFFVDLGFHFHWKYGSQLGLVHKSSLQYQSEYEYLTPGQEISIRFFGYDKQGKLQLGDHQQSIPSQWTEEERKELTGLIGSVHKLTVKYYNENKLTLELMGKYQASLPIKKEFYGTHRRQVRDYVEKLEVDASLVCEVVRVEKRQRQLVVKLVDWEKLIEE